MYDDIAALRPYKATADLLAEKCDWSQLYDPTTLATNRVPSAAVSYVEDVYVDFNMAMVRLGWRAPRGGRKGTCQCPNMLTISATLSYKRLAMSSTA